MAALDLAVVDLEGSTGEASTGSLVGIRVRVAVEALREVALPDLDITDRRVSSRRPSEEHLGVNVRTRSRPDVSGCEVGVSMLIVVTTRRQM